MKNNIHKILITLTIFLTFSNNVFASYKEVYFCSIEKDIALSSNGGIKEYESHKFKFQATEKEIKFSENSKLDFGGPFKVTYMISSNLDGVNYSKHLVFDAENKYRRISFDDGKLLFSYVNPSSVESILASCERFEL
jgi:hypothetical protein